MSASGDSTLILWDTIKKTPLSHFMDHEGILYIFYIIIIILYY